jgi:hypothetical protein
MYKLMNVSEDKETHSASQHLKPTHENIIRDKWAPKVDRDLALIIVIIINELIEHF